MAGFQANAGEMMSSATTIQGVASDVEEYKAKVTASAVGPSDFGRAHTAGGSRYLAGLPKVAEAVAAHSAALKGLADKLRNSANGYDWSDTANAQNLANTGGK
ncbi:type VII secretion target [Umezawaea sp.]|uniref:type VII secretion target n=1 Tax=Umezawaea sp. TaxID=1955258 RepID=UPI002ED27169